MAKIDLRNCTRLEAIEHFLDRGKKVVGEMRQLKTDVESYRDNVGHVDFDLLTYTCILSREEKRLEYLQAELVKERANPTPRIGAH